MTDYLQWAAIAGLGLLWAATYASMTRVADTQRRVLQRVNEVADLLELLKDDAP